MTEGIHGEGNVSAEQKSKTTYKGKEVKSLAKVNPMRSSDSGLVEIKKDIYLNIWRGTQTWVQEILIQDVHCPNSYSMCYKVDSTFHAGRLRE